MPITTGIQIIIALAGYVDRPAPPWQYLGVSQIIRLVELPSSGAFTLHVSKGVNTGEAQLSAVESQQLTTLLAQLPSDSMTAEMASFDGIIYELRVLQAEQPLSFHWQNEDWRYDAHSPMDKWKPVAALADYVLKLVKEYGDK
ncbi:MAG: hypothetical protein JXM69_14465 [Anaerolineae bacterium]|nr:hypothetical protein [Anaerolineae bacterium]